MTAVFLWWNEVKQNIPTIKVFSQKKISIIRLFRGRSLFLKGHIKRGSSPEKPTQTSCTINYKRATRNSLQKIHPSWHPLFGSASLGDPVSFNAPPGQPKRHIHITMRTYPLSRKGSSISIHDTWMNYVHATMLEIMASEYSWTSWWLPQFSGWKWHISFQTITLI